MLEKGHRSGQLLISISAEPRRYLPDAHRGSISRRKGKGQSHANMFKRDLAEDTEGDRTHMTVRATRNQKRRRDATLASAANSEREREEKVADSEAGRHAPDSPPRGAPARFALACERRLDS